MSFHIFKKTVDIRKLWKKAPQIVNHLTLQIIQELEQHDIKVQIFKGVRLAKNDYNRGFFRHPDALKGIQGEVSFCLNKCWEWGFMTLVHEYCHFKQWQENGTLWQNSHMGDLYAGAIINDWLKGQKYSSKDIKMAFKKVRALEMDCEKRVNKYLKKHHLPDVVVKMHAQMSNTHLTYYHWIEAFRRKASGSHVKPTTTKSIFSLAPDTLNSPEYICPKVFEAFTKTYNRPMSFVKFIYTYFTQPSFKNQSNQWLIRFNNDFIHYYALANRDDF
jgi:hypothetical protein